MEDNYDFSKLKKKKRVNSKTKGNTFERSIAKILNDRFNTLEFSRTPGSGAYATTHNLPEHLKIHGDLIAPKGFRYCLECKKGYNKESLASLFNDKSELWKFITQAVRDAEAGKKLPMVIFKQDNQKTLALTTEVFLETRNVISIFGTYYIYLFDELINAPDYFWFD